MPEGLPLLDIGQSGLLALVFILVITDRLVWHKRLDIKDKQIDAQNETIKDLTKQNGLLLESVVPMVDKVLNALHEAAGDGDQ